MDEKKKRACMMPVCRGEKFLLVHKIPRNREKADQWINAIQIPKFKAMDVDDIRKRHFLCSRHFRASDYKNKFSRSLNANAIPSINLTVLDNFDIIDLSLINSQLEQMEHTAIELPSLTPAPTPSEEFAILNTEPPKKVLRLLAVPPPEPKMLYKIIAKKKPVPKPLGPNKILLKTPKNTTNMKGFFKNFELPSVTQVSEEVLKEIEPKTPKEKDAEPTIELMDDHLVLKDFDHLQLDYFWLRDHCRCHQCFNHSTFQRILSITDIPLDIKPASVTTIEETLLVKWLDGHESEYELSFLSANTLESRLSKKMVAITWNRDTILRFSYARVAMTEYLCEDAVCRKVVQSLVDYGVAFIERVPPNAMFTEIVIKRLFSVHKTLFGEVWTFADGSSNHKDSAYTATSLPAHTDNTYFNDASGLQVLHCTEYEAEGGESLLVDGFKVLENFKLKEPEAYDRLKRTQVPAEYIEKNAHHYYTAPIIRENEIDGSVEQLRFNMLDRAPMNTLPVTELRQFYSDLRKLTQEVENPANEWWQKLHPGTVMIFNNWRILHGRGSYVGKRVMSGGYVSRTEFMSVARTMGIVN